MNQDKDKDKGQQAGQHGDADQNQGEGDKRSARRYNEAQQAFVHSSRGQDAIEDAGDVSLAEAREGERAEAAGRARAKGEDPAVTQRDGDGKRR